MYPHQIILFSHCNDYVILGMLRTVSQDVNKLKLKKNNLHKFSFVNMSISHCSNIYW